MSTADPDSTPCVCGDMRGIHKAAAPHRCARAACGCARFRARTPGATAVPEPPRVIQGDVERELPPAAKTAPALVPGPVTLTRVQLAICPACDVDRCDTCFGDGCGCGCQDAAPKPPGQPRHLRETMTVKQDQAPGSAAANLGTHMRAKLRALGWTPADLAEKSGISAHITGRAINGNGAELSVAEKFAELLGGSLVMMIGPYRCTNCNGEPPAGFSCLECGAEARAA